MDVERDDDFLRGPKSMWSMLPRAFGLQQRQPGDEGRGGFQRAASRQATAWRKKTSLQRSPRRERRGWLGRARERLASTRRNRKKGRGSSRRRSSLQFVCARNGARRGEAREERKRRECAGGGGCGGRLVLQNRWMSHTSRRFGRNGRYGDINFGTRIN